MVVRVGISGWTYPPWRSTFYPAKLAHRAELAYAAERLSSIEINGSFYALQRPSSFLRWAQETPEDFVFSVKAGRFITHMKRPRDVDRPLADFFASGVLALGPKLGPILWQLPPTLAFEPERIESFLVRLPHSTGEAAHLAGQHDDRVKDRAWIPTDADRPLRHAMEVRHDSYRDPRFLGLLSKHSVAVVVADTAGRWPQFFDVTVDFVYVRLRAAQELYASGYDDMGLHSWAERIRSWTADGHDVFAYFDNDIKVRSPYDAMSLMRILTDNAGS
jgi:uncharacterized protein YecE (DUF72 family)